MLHVSHKLFICTLGSNKICFSQSCNELNQASLPYTTAKNVEKALGSQNNAEVVCSGHCLVILPMAPEAHYYVPACQFILKSTAMPESLKRSFGTRTCLSASPNSLNAGESWKDVPHTGRPSEWAEDQGGGTAAPDQRADGPERASADGVR